MCCLYNIIKKKNNYSYTYSNTNNTIIVLVLVQVLMFKWITIVKCVKFLSNKTKSKYNHFISKSYQEFDKCKHILLSLKDIDINDVYEAFYLYFIEHNKKFDYYLVKCQFKLVFDDSPYCPHVTSKLSDKKTLIPWKSRLEEVIDDLKNKGYTFNQIAEMHIITIANKLVMSYVFYIEHNMHAVEWKLNALISKNKSLINNFNRNWWHPVKRKFER